MALQYLDIIQRDMNVYDQVNGFLVIKNVRNVGEKVHVEHVLSRVTGFKVNMIYETSRG